MLQAQLFCSMLRYKHASFGNMLWVECGFNFTYGIGREERWICRRGWYLKRRGQKPLIRKTWWTTRLKQMETVWHWLLQLLIFQKLGKSGFCTCHLEKSITQWMHDSKKKHDSELMQTRYQLKAWLELLL